jgi:hypothetical protein
MSTNRILIAVALVVTLVAAGTWIWMKFLNVSPPQQQATVLPAAPGDNAGEEIEFVNAIRQSGSGGFSATFSGTEAEKWLVAPGTTLERFSIGGAGAVFGRISSAQPLLPDAPLSGAYVEIPQEFATAAAGQRIEVGIVARASQANPAAKFGLNLYTRKMGNTGWLGFKLAGEFQMKVFEYEYPVSPDGYEQGPVIAIYGDPEGGNKGVEILGVYVKVKS